MTFVSTYLNHVKDLNAKVRESIENQVVQAMCLMQYAGETPDKQLLEYIADMPTSETGRNNLPKEVFAPRLTNRDIWNIYWKAEERNIHEYYTGSELGYSILRCTAAEKRFINAVKKMKKSANAFTISKKQPLTEQYKEEVVKCFVNHLPSCVSIYGAGKIGKKLVAEIEKSENIQLKHWWDQKADALKCDGFSVERLERIEDDCGLIIIAILDKGIAAQVYDNLLLAGADEKNIIIFSFPYSDKRGVTGPEYVRLFSR